MPALFFGDRGEEARNKRPTQRRNAPCSIKLRGQTTAGTAGGRPKAREHHLKQIRKRLTYANVMSSIAVFLVIGGASAFAAGQLGKNSVGSKQLKKNAVTAAKIKKNAVTGAKIQAAAVTGAEVKDGSLAGADINVGTLGTVPSAGAANSLVGQTPFVIRLGFGQNQTIATNGAVSLVAECLQANGSDIARIAAATTVNGAVMAGRDFRSGSSPTTSLNVDTPVESREMATVSDTSGRTFVDDTFSEYVLGPDGKGLTVSSNAIALGLNYGQPGCLAAGVVNAVG